MSEDVFVLVFAARYYKATARFIFRDLCKHKCLNDNLIDMIHERYMLLVHLDESARSTIHAALQRAWVQKTLRVPITLRMEEVLLQDKRRAEQDTRNAARASRNAAMSIRCLALSSSILDVQQAEYDRFLQDPIVPPEQSGGKKTFSLKCSREKYVQEAKERLAVAEQRAASDAAEATSLAETEEKRAASDAVRATEIARIGPMMKIPDWVKVVVFFT